MASVQKRARFGGGGMFFITSDRYRVLDIRDHVDPGLPIWTKENQYAVEIASTEFLDSDEGIVAQLPEGWVALK